MRRRAEDSHLIEDVEEENPHRNKHIVDQLENAILSYMIENGKGFKELFAGIAAYLKDTKHLGVRKVRVNDSWTFIKARVVPKTDLGLLVKNIIDYMMEEGLTWVQVYHDLFNKLSKADHKGMHLVEDKKKADWFAVHKLPSKDALPEHDESPGRKSVAGVVIPENELIKAKDVGAFAQVFSKYFKDSHLKYGAHIASGFEGDVYAYGSAKVIKYGTTWYNKLSRPFGDSVRINIRDIVSGTHMALKSGKSCVAQVFDFKLVGKFQIEDAAHKIKPEIYFAYYMISELLKPVDWGHCATLRVRDIDVTADMTIRNHNVINAAIMFNNKESLEAIKQEDRALYKKIIQFNACIEQIDFKFNDKHRGNIMQNKDGVLKLIDFGRFEV